MLKHLLREMSLQHKSGESRKRNGRDQHDILKKAAAQLPRNSELRELLILLPDRTDAWFLLSQVRTWRALARMEDMNGRTGW